MFNVNRLRIISVCSIKLLFIASFIFYCSFASAASSLEENLKHMADEFDELLWKSGQIHDDPTLNKYLQDALDKLYPDYVGKMKVRVLKAPVLNAFALPNGSIYMNAGLLSTFENEAQLATVLAHEGIHYINNHIEKGYKTTETMNAMSTFMSLAIGAMGLSGFQELGADMLERLLAIGIVSGYSRHLETEADIDGFDRLKRAGYDIQQSPKVFEYLLEDVKVNKIQQPFFFSSHPKLERRISNFEKLINENETKSGKIGVIYNSQVLGLRQYTIDQKLKSGMYRSVIFELSRPHRGQLYGDHYKYYIGEAYRLDSNSENQFKAESLYKDALNDSPSFPSSYRSLGLIYYEKKDCNQAIDYFNKYLEMHDKASDKSYIEYYLKNCGT